eukprot:scaffold134527_cov52-Attheya_sp.AAC.1
MARSRNRIILASGILLVIAISIASNTAFTIDTQVLYSVVVSPPVDDVDPPSLVASRSIHNDSLLHTSPLSDVLGVADHTTAIGTEEGNEDESICDNEKWCNYSPIPGQEKELCVPMRKWQTSSYPTGNIIHEIDMIPRLNADDIEYISAGAWRIAWKVGDIVLKTMKAKVNFDDVTAEMMRYDSMVMEQRTTSPLIINMYGMTAGSQLLELAPGGGLTSEKVKTLSPQKKLEYAIDIAQSVADLHGPDNTLVHSDLKGNQVIFMPDGKLKLGDFNVGFFQRWNKVRNLPCPMKGGRKKRMGEQPYEQIINLSKSEKVDSYGIGMVIYFLLTRCKPFLCEPTHLDGAENIIERKRNGIPPTLPIEIANSTIPEIKLMRLAMNLASRGDPEKRPSAQSIANLLKGT